MAKHIVIVSEESAIAGYYKCGIGEVVDGLADALRKYFTVTLITVGTRCSGCIGGTITTGTDGDAFLMKAAEHINMICPDVVHNFAHPVLAELLQVDCPMVLSFDRWEDVAEHTDCIPLYDHVITMSAAYAEQLREEHPETAAWPMEGLIAGIDGKLWPKLTKPKAVAKQRYYTRHDREMPEGPMMLSMGRLVEIKGIQCIIDAAAQIAAAGADLVVYGVGEPRLERQLRQLHEDGVLTYYPRMGGYFEMLEALEAADFYLMPSHSEACGLMPMKAARMGAVPIVRPVGGLRENFHRDNAVPITDDLMEAVDRALQLPDYTDRQQRCIEEPWTWETRVLPYIALYGLETERIHKLSTIPFAVPVTPEPEIPFARKKV